MSRNSNTGHFRNFFIHTILLPGLDFETRPELTGLSTRPRDPALQAGDTGLQAGPRFGPDGLITFEMGSG